MCITALAANTITAEIRIGSHSTYRLIMMPPSRIVLGSDYVESPLPEMYRRSEPTALTTLHRERGCSTEAVLESFQEAAHRAGHRPPRKGDSPGATAAMDCRSGISSRKATSA